MGILISKLPDLRLDSSNTVHIMSVHLVKKQLNFKNSDDYFKPLFQADVDQIVQKILLGFPNYTLGGVVKSVQSVISVMTDWDMGDKHPNFNRVKNVVPDTFNLLLYSDRSQEPNNYETPWLRMSENRRFAIVKNSFDKFKAVVTPLSKVLERITKNA